jgi:hypothetical protein
MNMHPLNGGAPLGKFGSNTEFAQQGKTRRGNANSVAGRITSGLLLEHEYTATPLTQQAG